jgi:DNA-binding MarR family transcriptional regulator
MTRQTSIEAYRQIAAEGLLSRMRLAVYDALYRHGPLTAGELTDYLHMRQAAVSARLTELVTLSVATEIQERICTNSGRRVIEFDVTDKLPTRLPARQSKSSRLKERIADLERQNAQLKRELANAGCLFCRKYG